MEKVFNYAIAKHGSQKAIGTRQVLAEEEVQSDGLKLKKVFLEFVRPVIFLIFFILISFMKI